MGHEQERGRTKGSMSLHSHISSLLFLEFKRSSESISCTPNADLGIIGISCTCDERLL